jgi:signal transduction histidine kinase
LTRNASCGQRWRVPSLLVGELDARGRARTLDRRPGDLVHIARDVIDHAEVLATAKDVSLTLEAQPSLACRLDVPSVRRAVANLVDNAIRYAPDGSTVTLEIRAGEATASVLVHDRGPGIPSDEQEQIFERFWRGDPDAARTGLGLAIARQIAIAHGGDITLRSPGPGGNGCTFELQVRR